MPKQSKTGSAKAAMVAPFQGLFKMVRDVMLGRQDALDNRRTEARFRVSLPLIARVGEVDSVCESVDLGASGIRLLMANQLTAGDKLRLSVPSHLGFAGHQRVLCEVAWSRSIAGRGYETGLLFADTKQNFEDSWISEALKFFKVEEKANRKHRRVPAEVFSEVFSQDGSSIGKGICKNLSPGGALLKFDRELTQGDIIKLGLGPSDQEAAIFMLGRVVLRQPADQPGFYLHSLRFLKGDRRQHLRLRSFLQSLLEEAAATGIHLEDDLPIEFSSVLENQPTTSGQLKLALDDEETRQLLDANAEGKIRIARTRKPKSSAAPINSPDFNRPVPLGAPVDALASPYPTQALPPSPEPEVPPVLDNFRRPGAPIAKKEKERPVAASTPKPESIAVARKPEPSALAAKLERIPLGAPVEPVLPVNISATAETEPVETVAADELPQNSPKLKDRLKQAGNNESKQPLPTYTPVDATPTRRVKPKASEAPKALPLEPTEATGQQHKPVTVGSVPEKIAAKALPLELATPETPTAQGAVPPTPVPAKTVAAEPPKAAASVAKPTSPLPATPPTPVDVKAGADQQPKAAASPARQEPTLAPAAVQADSPSPTRPLFRSNSMWAARSLQLRPTRIEPKNSNPSVPAPEPPEAERDFQW